MKKLFGTLLVTVFLATMLAGFAFAQSRTGVMPFSFTPNTETNLAGYKIYIGLEPGVYGPSVDIGIPAIVNGTSFFMLDGFEEGVQYYFTATAYDTDGFESDYAPEIFGFAKTVLASVDSFTNQITILNRSPDGTYTLMDADGNPVPGVSVIPIE